MNDSGFGRLVGVLLSPEKTFRSIAERPTWLAPLLVLMVLGTLVGYLVNQRTDLEAVIRHQMAQSDREISQEQLEQGVEIAKKIGPISVLVIGVVISPLLYMLIAAVFLALVRLMGSDIDFRRSLSVLLHGMMPWAVHGLLALPIVLSRESIDPETLQRGILMSNLGAFASEDAGPILKALLASLDVFTIWTLILLILGYRVVGKVSTMAATGIVLSLWLLYLAGKLGWVAIFS